jgi:hypothetical protein
MMTMKKRQSVTPLFKDTLADMGVIHQWVISFQKGGRPELEDHAEI